MPQKLVHRLIDEAVVNGLFSLVLIGGLGRKARRDQRKAGFDVGIGDLALILEVLAVCLQPAVDLRDEGNLDRLFRASAVLEPARVVVILGQCHLVGKAEGNVELHFIFGPVLPVAASALGGPALNRSDEFSAHQLGEVVGDAVLIEKLLLLKGLPDLVSQDKMDAGIDHRLPPDRLAVVLQRHVDVGENVEVGAPADAGAGLPALGRLFFQAAHIFPMLKMQRVAIAVPENFDIHIFRGILGRAEAQAV